MSSSRFIDLKPNRYLINPDFGGYKLSLDALPVYTHKLNNEIDVTRLSDDIYSYQHLKAFGNTSCIYLDPFNSNTVWFITSKWMIQKATIQGRAWGDCLDCFQIPGSENRQFAPNRVNNTLHFTSDSWITVSDGTGFLYILCTGNRQGDSSWKVGYEGEPLGEGVHFRILHSMMSMSDTSAVIHILCVQVVSNDDSVEDTPVFMTKLEWLTFQSTDLVSFKLLRHRRLTGSSCPDYAVVMQDGSTLAIACEKPFKFEYDSVNPVHSNASADVNCTEDETKPTYTWQQDDTSLTVSFELPDGCDKTDIEYVLHPTEVSVSLKNHGVLLAGNLFGLVDVDASAWTIEDNKILQLHLSKAEQHFWTELVVGDSHGQRIFTAEQMSEISDRLEKFTSDKNEEVSKPGYNVQQLEECDMMPDDMSVILVFDGESHDVIQQVNTSTHQWLLNASMATDNTPAICLRHDVDGFVWQPSIVTVETKPTVAWQHIGTFDAFGYVQASKQQRKFTTCATDLSFVAISDNVRHIYIYHQPKPVGTALHNRRTGQKVAAIARQQLVSLESNDEILGMCTNDAYIFILCSKTLYAIRAASDDV